MKRWIEYNFDGVVVGLWVPQSWQSDNSDGVIVAEDEHSGHMMLYVFMPPTSEFHTEATEESYALNVLREVVRMPIHIGRNVAFTPPRAFTWDEHDAAYYLLSDDEGMCSIVLAVSVPGLSRLVVLNATLPSGDAHAARDKLIQLLDGLTIEGAQLSGEGLRALPDPLEFPFYGGDLTQS